MTHHPGLDLLCLRVSADVFDDADDSDDADNSDEGSPVLPLTSNANLRPGIVHRLDMGTTGTVPRCMQCFTSP